jgi:serine/threonine protein kinase
VNPGDRYGRYQVIRLIGRGAMGEVFFARDMESNRDVALKIVYKGTDPEDHEVLEAERLGAELQKRLSGADPRVVHVKRYGEIAGDLFIEMEYIEGDDLSSILAKGPVQAGFAVYIAGQLCEMLENLRTFTTTIADQNFIGVIHGDLKPRNIRLNKQNHVKVIDFGIAKALSHTRKYTMNVFASTAYCSPERLETQTMDSHSDLWSVGVLFYQMISGRLPFDEPSKERLERRIRGVDGPALLQPDVPEPLRRIILKMLARDPARRYQSASAVSADLARFQNGEPLEPDEPLPATVEQPETDATIRTAPPESALDDRTVRTVEAPVKAPPSPPSPGKRSHAVIGFLGVVAVVSIVTIGFGLTQYDAWNDAGRLKTDLQAERISNLDEGWKRYQSLEKRAHIPFVLHGAHNALKDRLVYNADRVIMEYRNSDTPSVYEAQWIQARNNLARALELDPGDKSIRGRLRLTEGHIERINSAGLKGPARQKRLNSSVSKFEEAADLLKRSPDPYLGLARIAVYDFNDMDKAEGYLKRAQEFGHDTGKRELSQLADGYRKRADRLWHESHGFAKAPEQERDYLRKAREDYGHAQRLYQQAGLFANGARNQLQIIEADDRVQQRLAELDRGTSAQ